MNNTNNNNNNHINAYTAIVEPPYDYKLKRIGRLAKSWPEYIAAIALSNAAREVGRLEHLVPGVGNNTRTGIRFNGMYSASAEPIGIDQTCLVNAGGHCVSHNANHHLEIIENHVSALVDGYAGVDFNQAMPDDFALAVLWIAGHIKDYVPPVNRLAVLTEVVRRFQLRIAQDGAAAGDS